MEPVLKRPSYDPKQEGQDGRPVHIDDNSLTEAEKTERQRLRDRFMIDHMISEKVSLHRRPGEHRHKKCIDLANKGYRSVSIVCSEVPAKDSSLIFNIFLDTTNFRQPVSS